MGIFEKIKKIFGRNKGNLLNSADTGNLNEYNRQYEEDKDYLKSEIKRLEETRDRKKAWHDKLLQRDFSDIISEEYKYKLENDEGEYKKALSNAFNEYQGWEYSLREEYLKLPFIRPNTQSDIDERKQIDDNFVKLIHQADPESRLNLRFHGTSIHFAKEIIENGGIFSSRDRLGGYASSTNSYGEISVTSLENVKHYFPHGMPYHLDFSMGLMDINKYDRSYPAGCLFVLIPRNQEESDMIETGQMYNVNFKENPNTLYAVMTTTENLEKVKQWMIENGLNSNKVCTMDGLVKKAKRDAVVSKCDVSNVSISNEANIPDNSEIER